jgi:GNAT superfamily N-acetyltransferase
MLATQESRVTVRTASVEDAPVCGQICYDAFSTLNQRHGFPCDFPGPEVTIGLLSMLFAHPDFYCVVAEVEGRIVGSNCLDERSVIAGVGPVTIDPSTQNLGVGRKLMQQVMDRSHQRGAAGIRLVQAAFHNRSLSLYARLGFDIQEPLACMQGRITAQNISECSVRAAQSEDLAACNSVSHKVHGFDRGTELMQGIQRGTARVVERAGRITGYASDLAFFGHATAETNLDLQALISSAESFGGSGILVPTRNSTLFRWCLANGLRVIQLMTLMSTGLYNEPSGAWLPSVTF